MALLLACAPAATAPRATPGPRSVAHLLDSLPLRARVAQLVMPWMPGGYANTGDDEFRQALDWVGSLEVGGIIVSVGSPLEVAARVEALQRASALPLLIASDLESGTRIRLSGGTPFPPNMGVAAGGRDRDAWEIGRVTALEGRAVGIHMAFAPSADVNNNPANPIINTRAFGEDPATVARFTAEAVRGIERHGMMATAKHFPGHGDTDTDSHLALPVIQADWARLDSLELVPFRAAIDAGVDAVMSAHIALPAVDTGATHPATTSPLVLTGILRDSLGFDGMIVTDALNMQGVVSLYGAGEAAVLALEAGADLLLMPADAGQAIDAVAAAVRDGRISEERLNRSVRRMLDAKWRLGLFRDRHVPLDSVMQRVGTPEARALADSIATRSIVLAADDGTVDSLRAAPRRIALVQYGEGTADNVGTAFAAGLRAAGHTVTAHRLTEASGSERYAAVRAALDSAEVTVFAVAVRAVAWRGSIGLPAPLTALIDSSAAARPTLLASFGSPYVIMQTPAVGAYLVAWSSYAPSERAAARALSGAPITGRLPITIPPRFPLGAGLDR